jgi:ubiquitin C-terminal hydrolase
MEQWEQYLLRDKSVMVDLFQGQFLSTLTCQECFATSHKFDSFVHLSVDVN